MDPISDPFEFEHVMYLVDLAVAELPLSRDVLEYRLSLLIDDALSDLKRDRVFSDGSQLNENEKVAAEWLIAIRHARRQLKANNVLSPHALHEIRNKGWIVMAWRLWNSAHDLHERNRAAQRARRKYAQENLSPDYKKIYDAAKRLLAHGTPPRNLVAELHQTAAGAEYSREWLRELLRRWRLLPKKKK